VFIRSERLFLRPAWPEDRAELHDLTHDEAIAHDWTVMPQGLRHPRFVITRPDLHGAEGGAPMIGTVGFTNCDGADCEGPDSQGSDSQGPDFQGPDSQGDAELGIWIASGHRSRGYATEAARAALTLARTLGHCRVLASQFVDSPASARVLSRLGFIPAGPSRLRHSAAQGRFGMVVPHALVLCPPVSGPADPADPAMLRRAA
jgi:RimJ/RimL family protein N-acetyltransferase